MGMLVVISGEVGLVMSFEDVAPPDPRHRQPFVAKVAEQVVGLAFPHLRCFRYSEDSSWALTLEEAVEPPGLSFPDLSWPQPFSPRDMI